MKKFFTIFILVFIISHSLPAQVIKEKQAFAEAFVRVFEQRASGFDSLKAKDWEDSFQSIVKMPGSTESYISENLVYGALYRDSDSLKMLGLYKEIKQLLAYVASYYKASVKFKPFDAGDPYYEQFFFADSSLFTSEGSNISFFKSISDHDEDDEEDNDFREKSARKDSFEVLLLIKPGNSISYFTSAGEKLHDAEVKQIISQIAFGSDPWLNKIKVNKRVQKEANYYDSKLSLKGFSSEIREGTGTRSSYLTTTLTKIFNTTEESFMRSADSLLIKVKTAMPPGFCYHIDQDEKEILIDFKPVPFLKEMKNAPDITVIYSEIEGKKNMYRLVLKIGRTISK